MCIRITCCLCVTGLVLVSGAALAGQEAKKGAADLQGTWKIVSLDASVETAELPPRMPRWVIKGEKVYYGGEMLAMLTVDPATTPKTMDLKFVDREMERVFEGIYKVDGDKLTICVNKLTDGVKERPLDFTTEGNESRRLLKFTREKPGADDGTKDAPGFVGVQIGKDKDDMGVRVVATIAGSPAKKAGLKQDDVILRVGQNPATTIKEVVDLIRAVRPGGEVSLRIRRDDKEQDIKVRAGVLPFFLLD
jgi:uncharacterized protein (TIGR03067 family)